MLAPPPLTPVHFKCMYLLQVYRYFHDIWHTKGKLDLKKMATIFRDVLVLAAICTCFSLAVVSACPTDCNKCTRNANFCDPDGCAAGCVYNSDTLECDRYAVADNGGNGGGNNNGGDYNYNNGGNNNGGDYNYNNGGDYNNGGGDYNGGGGDYNGGGGGDYGGY